MPREPRSPRLTMRAAAAPTVTVRATGTRPGSALQPHGLSVHHQLCLTKRPARVTLQSHSKRTFASTAAISEMDKSKALADGETKHEHRKHCLRAASNELATLS